MVHTSGELDDESDGGLRPRYDPSGPVAFVWSRVKENSIAAVLYLESRFLNYCEGSTKKEIWLFENVRSEKTS